MVDRLRKIFVVFAIVAIAVMGLPVHQAKAATIGVGSLIKASGPAVYYYASNGKRYVFPNEKTYMTWYSDFSTVMTITDAELAAIQIGGNIVYRPGTTLVKITTDPKVYAVGPKGVLHWITSETVALELYGAAWNTIINDVPDAFFTNYTYGSDLTTAVHPDSALIKYAASSNIFVIEDGEKRLISDEASFTANMFMNEYVVTVADTVTYPTAALGLNVGEIRFTDVAQLWGGTIVPITGDLTVAVASTTPASFTAPLGGVGVEVAQFNFTAGPNPVALNGLVIKRTGLGLTTEIAKVYLYNGATKLTSGRSINSSTHTATFTNLGVTIPANTTLTLTVKVDLSATTGGGSHFMTVDGVGDVDCDANVGGIFPVVANEFTVSSGVSVGATDIESNGQSYTRKVGETDVEVANLSVYVDNTENAQFESIVLYNSGRDILSNLKAYRGSTLVATGSQSGDYWTFTLDTPYEIAKGDSAQFVIKGDISGRNGDTATLYVRYKTDVRVKGLTYGYALNVDVTEGASSTDSYVDEIDSTPSSNTTTAEAGQITASFNGPVASDVAKNTNDVVLMNFALTAQSAVDVEKTGIKISDSTGNLVTGDVEELELVCNGVIVTNWSTVNVDAAGVDDDSNGSTDPATDTIDNDGDGSTDEADEDTEGINSSTDIWTLPAGGVNCEVRANITNSAAGTEGLRATLLDLTGANWTFKDSATGDTLTDIVPSGNIAGNEMSVTVATLDVNLATTPAAGNIYVPNTAEADLTGFIFTAGAATDVKVTSIKFTAMLDDDQNTFADAADKDHTSGAKDIMTAVRVYDEDGVQLGTAKSLTVGTSDITATFDNLNWVIPAGTSVKLTVKSDISSTAPTSANDDDIAFAIIANGDITAEYGSNGAALVATATNINAPVPSVFQTVTTVGTLNATLDADTPLSDVVATGSSVAATKIKFAATNEDIKVEKLRIVNDDTVTTDDDEYESVTLSYTNSAGNTETKTAYFIGSTADFNVLDILVPKNDSTIVTATANYNTSVGGADNAQATFLGIIHNTNFRAVTMGSGVVLTTTANAVSFDGNAMYTFESYPTFTVANNSGDLVAGGQTLIGEITISANANEDITFINADTNILNVDIYANGATVASNVWITDGATTLCDNGGATTSLIPGSAVFACDFASLDLSIAKGTSKTLKVYMDTLLAGLTTSGEGVYIALTEGDNVDWSIDSDTANYGSAAIGGILFRGNLVGGTLTVQ